MLDNYKQMLYLSVYRHILKQSHQFYAHHYKFFSTVKQKIKEVISE